MVNKAKLQRIIARKDLSNVSNVRAKRLLDIIFVQIVLSHLIALKSQNAIIVHIVEIYYQNPNIISFNLPSSSLPITTCHNN